MRKQEKWSIPGHGYSSARAKTRNRAQTGRSLLWLRMRSLKPQRGKENAPTVTQLISSRTGICLKILCFVSPTPLGDPSALGLLQKGQRLHVVEVPDRFEKVLPVGVGAGSVSGLCRAGVEPGTGAVSKTELPGSPQGSFGLQPRHRRWH